MHKEAIGGFMEAEHVLLAAGQLGDDQRRLSGVEGNKALACVTHRHWGIVRKNYAAWYGRRRRIAVRQAIQCLLEQAEQYGYSPNHGIPTPVPRFWGPPTPWPP